MLISLLKGEITQDEYLRYNNAKIIKENLPKRIYGFIFKYKNENIILINKTISYFKQRKTLLHEFAHLELNHLNNKKRILEFKFEGLEDEADMYIENLTEQINKNI